MLLKFTLPLIPKFLFGKEAIKMKGNKKSEMSNEALESVAGGFGEKNWTEKDREDIKKAFKEANASVTDPWIDAMADLLTVDEFYKSDIAKMYKLKRPSK